MNKKTIIITLSLILMILSLLLLVTFAYFNFYKYSVNYNVSTKISNKPTFSTSGTNAVTFNISESNMTIDNVGTTIASQTFTFYTYLQHINDNNPSGGYCCTYNVKVKYTGNLNNFTGFNVKLYNSDTNALYISKDLTLTSGMSDVNLLSTSICTTNSEVSSTYIRYYGRHNYKVVSSFINNNTVQDQLYGSGTQKISVYVTDVNCD